MTTISTATIDGKLSVIWNDSDIALAEDRVRLTATLTGISAGTEGMWYDGSAPALVSGRRGYPYTPGYEFVGVVAEIGSGVSADPAAFPRLSTLKVGDRVFAFKPHASSADISEQDLWVALEPHVRDEDALGLALTCTALHAIHRVQPVMGDASAVIGLGVLGMIMIQMLAAQGAGRIVASTRSPKKSDEARSYGATEIVDTNAFAAGKAPEGYVPCHAVFECSGTENGIALAPKLAANQGIIGAAGFYTGSMPLPGEDVFAKELTIVGVRASGANGNRSEFVRWPRTENLKLASQYLHAGKMSVKDLVSHRLKPTELVDAYEIVRTKSEPYMLMVLDWR